MYFISKCRPYNIMIERNPCFWPGPFGLGLIPLSPQLGLTVMQPQWHGRGCGRGRIIYHPRPPRQQARQVTFKQPQWCRRGYGWVQSPPLPPPPPTPTSQAADYQRVTRAQDEDMVAGLPIPSPISRAPDGHT
jgi:hypothetical protein